VPVSKRSREVAEAAQDVRALAVCSLELAGDVTQRQDVRYVIDRMLEKMGRIDILVNSAGTVKRAPSLEFTDEDWRAHSGCQSEWDLVCLPDGRRSHEKPDVRSNYQHCLHGKST
jgi:NADP-dependent 3-hydroxy acid dehydrogenase YdfG